jgi:hypothetical protein
MTLAGPLLSAVDSSVTTGSGPFLDLVGASSFASTSSDPLIQLGGTTGSPLTALSTYSSTSSSTDSTGTTWTYTHTSTSGTFLEICCGTYDSTTSTTIPTTMTLGGPLLSATNSAIQTGDFLSIGSGGGLTVAGTAAPLIQLTNSPLTAQNTSTYTSETRDAAGNVLSSYSSSYTYGSFLKLGGTLSLSGPLLNATNSPLTIAESLVSISNGGQLTSTTPDPLIAVSGGTHEIGSSTFSWSGSLLDLRGVNTDANTGLGTDRVLQTGGTILQADSATLNLSGSGNAIRVDRALLEASAPIIKLINSTVNTSSEGDATTGAMHLYQSSVTSNGPVIGLDNSTLTVRNGPALSLTGGTTMTVNGDFASLSNGSKITVQNGPMILVDGVNTKGTASTLTVTGALVNFGGTGGNQVIINNTITPNLLPSGVPVSVTGSGSSVTIGPNPIKNPSLGTFSVTGSAIQATNGGKVTITAPNGGM